MILVLRADGQRCRTRPRLGLRRVRPDIAICVFFNFLSVNLHERDVTRRAHEHGRVVGRQRRHKKAPAAPVVATKTGWSVVAPSRSLTRAGFLLKTLKRVSCTYVCTYAFLNRRRALLLSNSVLTITRKKPNHPVGFHRSSTRAIPRPGEHGDSGAHLLLAGPEPAVSIPRCRGEHGSDRRALVPHGATQRVRSVPVSTCRGALGKKRTRLPVEVIQRMERQADKTQQIDTVGGTGG